MGNELKPILKEFLAFIVKKLNITRPFKVKLTSNRTEDFKTHAYYVPSDGTISVCIKNRQCADMLRSVAHEMIHHKQNQEGRLNADEAIPDIGGDIENEANSIAGQLVKEFGYTTKHNIYD